MVNFITFNINGQVFGMDMLAIEKIIKLSKISPIPSAPEYLEGYLDVQDNLIPAINLKKLLNYSSNEILVDSSVIIIFNENIKCAIIVDSINDIIEVNDIAINQIKNNKLIKGIVKVDDNIINLLNYNSLILDNSC